jgi:hypothetical protein
VFPDQLVVQFCQADQRGGGQDHRAGQRHGRPRCPPRRWQWPSGGVTAFQAVVTRRDCAPETLCQTAGGTLATSWRTRSSWSARAAHSACSPPATARRCSCTAWIIVRLLRVTAVLWSRRRKEKPARCASCR